MTERKLFVAKKENGDRVHVDSLRNTEEKLFCPHCDGEVIAKQGEEKIWHFAHKERVCSFLMNAPKDKVIHKDMPLEGFSQTFSDEIVVEESSNYKCLNCGCVGNKEYGKNVLGKWYCKDCFRLL